MTCCGGVPPDHNNNNKNNMEHNCVSPTPIGSALSVLLGVKMLSSRDYCFVSLRCAGVVVDREIVCWKLWSVVRLCGVWGADSTPSFYICGGCGVGVQRQMLGHGGGGDALVCFELCAHVCTGCALLLWW